MPTPAPGPVEAGPGASRRQVVVLGAALTLSGGATAACASGSAVATDPTLAAAAADPATTTPATTATTAPSSTSAASRPASTSATSASRTTTTTAPTTRTTPAKATTTSKSSAADDAKGSIIKLSAIPVGGSVVVAKEKVVVHRSGSSRVIGHSTACTHQGCPVKLVGTKLDCPCHGSQFDASTGAVLASPATRPLKAVALVVKGDYVHRA